MKKGFTLIELLAVIVILAIIALIATPIVLNIINETKKSSTLRSAGFYIDALQNEIALENMNAGGSFNPKECRVENSNLTCDEKLLEIKIDGEKPSRGNITFEDGKVTSVTLTYSNGTVIKNEKGELVFGEGKEEPVKKLKDIATTSTELGVTSVHACANSGTCEPGTAFAIKVNDEDTYKFYVLNEESGKVNLIMASNLGSNVAWIDKSDYFATGGQNWEASLYEENYAPITALKELKERTSSWINIQEYSYELDYGINDYYGTPNAPRMKYSGEYVKNVRARLPRKTDNIGCTNSYEECPSWIIDGFDDPELVGFNGYWITESFNDAGIYSFGVSSDGTLHMWNDTYGNTNLGLRPVITITK